MEKEKKSASWREIIVSIIVAFILVIIISFLLRFLEKLLVKEAEAKILDYQAKRIEQNPVEVINIEANKSITFLVKFKNVGQKDWLKGKVALKTATQKKSLFAHPDWPSQNTCYIVKWGVPKNTVGTFKFALKAPQINGLYWEKFQLFVGDQKIQDGEIEIGMKVYGGKNPEPILEQESSNGLFWRSLSSDYQIIEEKKYDQQPQIKVGLFYVEKKDDQNQEGISRLPIKIKTLYGVPYQVKTKSNYLILTQTKGEETEIDFNFENKRYFINVNGQRIASTDESIKFIPLFDGTIFQISSWYRGPFWGQEVNDNEYRGTLEIRFNPVTNRLWLINELPIEEYLKGVAEVQDFYPFEMLKAQKIAARTYAFFRYLFPKYIKVPEGEDPIFAVRATQVDQVYRGYKWELRSPNTQKAVEETKGMVIFYGQDPILAYYFAQSDGRTRSSCEAKMTKECLPYLVSVLDPPGKGKTLKGHGVGMPQQGAKVAAEEGANFHQILRYYYQGVQIKKIW